MESWFRYSLLATAIMNLMGAVLFALPIYGQGEIFGLPQNAHPLYLSIISSWIAIFGIAYFWLALTQRAEYLFIAVAAACKLVISVILFVFWVKGELPLISVSPGFGDFFLATVFIYWLYCKK